MAMKTIKLDQDLDAAAMVELRPLFEGLAKENSDIRLDLSNVSFVDSSGVGGLVFLFKRMRARSRKLHVSGLTGQPRRLFLQLQIGFLLDEKSAAA